MKRKFIAMLAFFACIAFGANAQVTNLTPEQLNADKTAKKDQIAALQGEIDKIDGALATMDYTGWKFGGNGGISFSGAGASNWWAAGDTVTNGLNTNITANLFANMSEDKFYWFNGLNVQLGYITNWFNLTDDFKISDATSQTLDKLYFSSLPGYRINSEFAVTALLDVQSSISNFANPAAISGGVGVTWTPVQTMDGKLIPLKVVLHPLTWKGNFVKKDGNQALRNEFGMTGDQTVTSEFGLKFIADYGRTLKILGNSIGWTSQLRGFAPYTSFNPLEINELGELVEGEATGPVELNWDNAFSILLFKNLAVSANWNLRNYKPETAFLFDDANKDNDKNWQHLWNFGFGLSTTF